MLLSQLLGERYREMPADATIASHAFFLKGGYIRPVANGVFTLLPPAKRIAKKIEEIIRQEMDRIGGQEVLFPVVLPRELWEESGRYETIGKELLRFTDRSGGDLVLAMTHEEAAVQLARSEAKSYGKYPFMIYQIQTKFRDEPRARGGLIRVREFTMKDAYSFHRSQEDLERYYEICHQAYQRIYDRCGVPEVVSVGSDSGMMGGAVAHEFMLLCDAGEDTIVSCTACEYRANMEVAQGAPKETATVQDEPLVKMETPNAATIEELCHLLQKPAEQMIKAAVFSTEDGTETILCFLRADLEVNEAKLRRLTGKNIYPFVSDEQSTPLTLGYCGPCGLESFDGLRVFYDKSLRGCKNMVAGANEAGFHFTGVSVGRDFAPEEYVDIAKVREGDACPSCGAPLQLRRGVEVGNIFQLGTKYTKSMDMTYIDQDGKAKYPVMGCYGIGVGRLLACIAEAHHDEHGPIWPYSVAPWQVHICALSNKKRNVFPEAESIYQQLSGRYETLLDDRGATAGVQFADADLLGVPIRIVVSVRNLEAGEVEISTRDQSVCQKVEISRVAEAVDALAEKLSG